MITLESAPYRKPLSKGRYEIHPCKGSVLVDTLNDFGYSAQLFNIYEIVSKVTDNYTNNERAAMVIDWDEMILYVLESRSENGQPEDLTLAEHLDARKVLKYLGPL